MSKIISAKMGVGIGYRIGLDKFISDNTGIIDVLEVIPEHYISNGRVKGVRKLVDLQQQFNLVVHGIASTLVSSTRPDRDYLRCVRQICEALNATYFSDHAMMTSADGFALGHLCPNLYDAKTLALAIRNIQEVEETLGIPLVVEYSTYTARFPGATWTPEEFFLELVHTHQSLGVLIDLSNAWYNGTNFGFDYRKFVRDLPADRVVHVHLAGGEIEDGFWIDSHSNSVHPEVFELLEILCEKADPDTIIIERDANYASAVQDLPGDLVRAKEILERRK